MPKVIFSRHPWRGLFRGQCGIEQCNLSFFELLGVHFGVSPNNWDEYFKMMAKAKSRMYILKGLVKVMAALVEMPSSSSDACPLISCMEYTQVWVIASNTRYLNHIDRLQSRALRYGYVKHTESVLHLLDKFGRKLLDKL